MLGGSDGRLRSDVVDIELTEPQVFRDVPLHFEERETRPRETQRPSWQSEKRAAAKRSKAKWRAVRVWTSRCGALVALWLVVSGVAFAWSGFGTREPLLHDYSPAELARGDFEEGVEALREYLVSTDPTATCVAGNVVGLYRSAVLVVVSDLAPPLVFLNPKVSHASERNDSPLHLDPANLLSFWGSDENGESSVSSWPPVPRVVYEETDGCDAMTEEESSWWRKWLLGPSVSRTHPLYRTWGDGPKKFKVSRENTVWVQWIDAKTRTARESWVTGFPAECLQHTKDVSAGVFTCANAHEFDHKETPPYHMKVDL